MFLKNGDYILSDEIAV